MYFEQNLSTSFTKLANSLSKVLRHVFTLFNLQGTHTAERSFVRFILSQLFTFVKNFFQTFKLFSSKLLTFCRSRRPVELVYLTTEEFVCQELFSKFFQSSYWPLSSDPLSLKRLHIISDQVAFVNTFFRFFSRFFLPGFYPTRMWWFSPF